MNAHVAEALGHLRRAIELLSMANEPVPIAGLTVRQNDVLHMVVRGMSNKEIAAGLALSEGTIKVHVAAVFRSLGVNSRAAAAAAGARSIKSGSVRGSGSDSLGLGGNSRADLSPARPDLLR
jgi:DNA-binding NarL/FixJ family response regulator